MSKAIQPRRTGRVQVTPGELTLEDLNLLICGWDNYVPRGDLALRTEDAFHKFLRRYGADPYGWDGPHPPEGYDLELELAGIIESWNAEIENDPRLTKFQALEPSTPISQKAQVPKPKRRPQLKPQVAAKAARSEDSKPSPAPEAVKEEAQKPKNEAWFYPAGGSGGSTNPLDEPWPEPFEEGEAN